MTPQITTYIKKYLLGFFLMILSLSCFSQPYGNEWINYNQQYFRIKVGKEGVYRISYNTLQQANIPLQSIDPRSFQLFNRGQEQHIYVHNEQNGVFTPNDYIEFFGNTNDGFFDKNLYRSPSYHANPHFSLINDTAIYYLTWTSSVNNKRITLENDINFSNYAPLPYFFNTVHRNFNSTYFYGETNALGSTDSEYIIGEGWFDNGFNLGGSTTKVITTPQPHIDQFDVDVEFTVVSASSPKHHLRVAFANQIIDTTYLGYKVLKYNRSIPADYLTNGSLQFTFSSINDQGSAAARNTIAYIRIKYPQKFHLSNQTSYKMLLPNGPQSKSLINMSNVGVTNADSAFIYDLTNHKRIKVVRQSNIYKALVPNTGQEKLCYITGHSSIIHVSEAVPVNENIYQYAKFNNFNSTPHNQSDYLLISETSLMKEAGDYKNYRNNSGYKVLLVNVEELYDQFGFGIRKHPLSIKNFVKFTYQQFENAPEYLFIIGKGINARETRFNTTHFKNSLVPSFGVPSSDNLFSTRIADTLFRPALATGRLAARTPSHVTLYLNKVIEYETTQQQAQTIPQEWMKNILHFGGGGNIMEQSLFSSYLNQYKNTIEDTLFGGYVRTFLKTSSAPIQINQSDSLKNLINNGVSLMTFFGHASGTGFDQSIDNPSDYNNYGKYPFLFANSCYAGDIFTPVSSSSESFVLIENKGVIGYLASTAPSPSSSLHSFASQFYKNIGIFNYGKSVGKSIQNTIQTLQNTTPNNAYIKEVSLVSVLHGDPAIKINSFIKPDFEVKQNSVFFTPYNITTEQDSFMVHIAITNKGMALSGNYIAEIKRIYPDNTTTETFFKQVPANVFKDTLHINLPVNRSQGVGINKINVTLDLYDEYDEITKLNNYVSIEFIITSADIIPVFPAKYAVVPHQTLTLKASTGNPFSGLQNYIFQIDTTDLFNSPLLVSHQISHTGGVVNWALPFNLTDSMVYYWRVALDDNQNNWRESSFQYIPTKRGWGQAHYFQFKNNTYQYVHYNRPDRNYVFVNNMKNISAQTGIYPHLAWNEHWYKMNGAVMDLWSCLWDVGNGIKFAVFNPISGEPWLSTNLGNNTGPYGNVHCKSYPVPAFDFYTHTDLLRDKIKAFLDTIPNDYYVLAYNHKNHFAQNYTESLYQAFESIGSANIRQVQNNTPYIIFGRKGLPIGYANEVIGNSTNSVISLQDSLQTLWNAGFVKSELIGPATKWHSIHWRFESTEQNSLDSIRLSVIGVKIDGQQDTLKTGISRDSLDIYNVFSFANAQTHPFMYLVAHMKDDSMHTPPQMKSWHVLYDGVPETALNPTLHYIFQKDTLLEGEQILFSCAIQNIGELDMDSLLVAYWIVDRYRNIHHIPYPRQAPHPVGHVLIDTVTYSTLGLPGLNSLWIEANPNYDQIEQYRFNNIAAQHFYVVSDKINPLLDVTFDGVHILNGDIVSANPEIQIILRDENKFIPVNDTSSFRVYLKKPGMMEPDRIFFVKNGLEQMRFVPATLPENISKVFFKPEKLEDGVYELLVQAKDASSNNSGQLDLNISFEVINKPTITEVMNWPNPFTTSTRFVFTLTGSELPTFMKIQIMTISGKIVREIDMTELGPLHIGRNITQYAWDGTDMFGDRLANGVYLYRVMARINDAFIEKNETSASKYFTHEFGKMYLMR